MLSEIVYAALRTAADQIGHSNYQSQLKAHLKTGKSKSTFRFIVSEAHAELCKAMGSMTISDEQAMGLLHQYDTFKERFGRSING